MYVCDLVTQLNTFPQDVWVDVMIPQEQALFTIEGVELYDLTQGNQRVVIQITEDAPLRAV